MLNPAKAPDLPIFLAMHEARIVFDVGLGNPRLVFLKQLARAQHRGKGDVGGGDAKDRHAAA